MHPVYTLTLGQLTGRWRLLITAGLAALPILAAWANTNQSSATRVDEFDLVIIATMFAGSILPLVVLAIASVAFSNELEDRTLANLTLSPIPRWQIAVPKLLAVITVAGPFMGLSAFFTAHVAFNIDWTATAAVTIGMLAAVALYGSVFTWLGLVSTKAIGIGLGYIVLWEGLFTNYVSGVRVLSIRHYAQSWIHAIDPRRFASDEHLTFAAALGVSALVFLGFLFLTVRRLRRMDVP